MCGFFCDSLDREWNHKIIGGFDTDYSWISDPTWMQLVE